MKTTRGFAVGMQLVLAASIFTSASADTDGVREVGIGYLHPICDPLQEECISSDEQVQDEIIAALAAEDTVVGTSPRPHSSRLPRTSQQMPGHLMDTSRSAYATGGLERRFSTHTSEQVFVWVCSLWYPFICSVGFVVGPASFSDGARILIWR